MHIVKIRMKTFKIFYKLKIIIIVLLFNYCTLTAFILVLPGRIIKFVLT